MAPKPAADAPGLMARDPLTSVGVRTQIIVRTRVLFLEVDHSKPRCGLAACISYVLRACQGSQQVHLVSADLSEATSPAKAAQNQAHEARNLAPQSPESVPGPSKHAK